MMDITELRLRAIELAARECQFDSPAALKQVADEVVAWIQEAPTVDEIKTFCDGYPGQVAHLKEVVSQLFPELQRTTLAFFVARIMGAAVEAVRYEESRGKG